VFSCLEVGVALILERRTGTYLRHWTFFFALAVGETSFPGLLQWYLIVPFSDSGHENPSLPGQSESPVSESESEFPLCALLRTPQRLGSGPEMCPDTSDPPLSYGSVR
jgi:hypothetical protein